MIGFGSYQKTVHKPIGRTWVFDGGHQQHLIEIAGYYVVLPTVAGALPTDVIVPVMNACNGGNMRVFIFYFHAYHIAHGNGVGTTQSFYFKHAFDAGLPKLA